MTTRDLTREKRSRLRGADQILQGSNLSLRISVSRLERLTDRALPGEAGISGCFLN